MRKLVSGAALISLSLFMALGFVKADLKTDTSVKIATFALAVVLPLGSGVGLLYGHQRDRHQRGQQTQDLVRNTQTSAILQLAQQSDGKLTLVEIVAELGLTPDQGQQSLDHLMQAQLAEIEVTESGTLVYCFPDIQALPEKARSQSILES